VSAVNLHVFELTILKLSLIHEELFILTLCLVAQDFLSNPRMFYFFQWRVSINYTAVNVVL
jgi:hypothetical protein